MKFLMTASALVILLSATSANAGGLKDADGTWVVVEATLAGQKLPAEALKDFKLTLKGDKYTVETGGITDKGTSKVDMTKKPMTIDITGTEGPNKGKTFLGIFELKGDRMRVCYDLEGKNRPTEFTSTKDNKFFLVTYKRLKKKGKSNTKKKASSQAQAKASPFERILHAQAKAWNAGDLGGFMDHYWKSDQLTFSSGGKVTRGWAKTLDGYKNRYPTRDKMGKLTFDGLEFTPLGSEAALLLGRWHLQRKADELGGNFTLVFRRIAGRWVIIHDHTSRLPIESTAAAPRSE